jgi:hypothetical protein
MGPRLIHETRYVRHVPTFEPPRKGGMSKRFFCYSQNSRGSASGFTAVFQVFSGSKLVFKAVENCFMAVVVSLCMNKERHGPSPHIRDKTRASCGSRGRLAN